MDRTKTTHSQPNPSDYFLDRYDSPSQVIKHPFKLSLSSMSDGDNSDPEDFLIKAEFKNYDGKYGSPRISRSLSGKGHPVSQATVGRRMKKMGLRVKKKEI